MPSYDERYAELTEEIRHHIQGCEKCQGDYTCQEDTQLTNMRRITLLKEFPDHPPVPRECFCGKTLREGQGICENCERDMEINDSYPFEEDELEDAFIRY